MNLKVSASIIGDFPLLSGHERFFREFKEAGMDGVEIVSGFKSRFRFGAMAALSKEYDLPITSIHQSAWSGVGVYFDERLFRKFDQLGVSTFVCHPLAFAKMDSKRMERYLDRMSKVQKRHNIKICIENMKDEKAYSALFADGKAYTEHLKELEYIADAYGIYTTFDTSHARFTKPQDEQSFRELFPTIRNIHLSSFHGLREHLPLTMGDFDTEGFIAYLMEHNYPGLITFEIFYPKIVSLRTYDFMKIKESVAMIKSAAGKLG